MAKTVLQVLRSLLVFGRAFLMGEKVSMLSQSALQQCATVLGWESLHSWFDKVQVQRIRNGIHGRTIFPGVEEPCGMLGRVVLRWSQSALLYSAVGPENVYY